MSTAHEPAYSEDGMPKRPLPALPRREGQGRHRHDHDGGLGRGVARFSPAAFGNLHAYDDEIVPWLRRLDRRVPRAWRGGDDPAHPSRPAHQLEQGGLAAGARRPRRCASRPTAPSPRRRRTGTSSASSSDYATAAQRMQAAGLDGIEFEAYGHLMDQFWSPATNRRDDEYGGSARQPPALRHARARRDPQAPSARTSSSACAWSSTRTGRRATAATEGLEIARRFVATGKIDFLNVIRGHIDTDQALSRRHPGRRACGLGPHLDFAGEVREATKFPVFHAARIADVATARHAIAEGKLDMVGMTRAHIADPHIVSKGHGGPRGRDPPLRRRDLLPRPHL